MWVSACRYVCKHVRAGLRRVQEQTRMHRYSSAWGPDGSGALPEAPLRRETSTYSVANKTNVIGDQGWRKDLGFSPCLSISTFASCDLTTPLCTTSLFMVCHPLCHSPKRNWRDSNVPFPLFVLSEDPATIGPISPLWPKFEDQIAAFVSPLRRLKPQVPARYSSPHALQAPNNV